MIQYKVAEEWTRYGLESAVNKLMQSGWVPQGSVTHTPADLWGDGEQYAQAMVRSKV